MRAGCRGSDGTPATGGGVCAAPRATAVVDEDPARLDLPDATATTRAALVEELVRVHAAVVTGQRHDPVLGPADQPVGWQGVGPHGHGGEGMGGGVPWGGPMAMPPMVGRDGLALLADWSGLARSRPGLDFAMVVALLSLGGIPPLAGFAGTFAVFAAAHLVLPGATGSVLPALP